MKKKSSGSPADPNAGHHDDKRGNGRTAAHPQLLDEEDEYGSGRRDTEDYEGDEDIAGRATHGREDLEDDSLEGAASRQRRSIRSGREETEDEEPFPLDPKSNGKPSSR